VTEDAFRVAVAKEMAEVQRAEQTALEDWKRIQQESEREQPVRNTVSTGCGPDPPQDSSEEEAGQRLDAEHRGPPGPRTVSTGCGPDPPQADDGVEVEAEQGLTSEQGMAEDCGDSAKPEAALEHVQELESARAREGGGECEDVEDVIVAMDAAEAQGTGSRDPLGPGAPHAAWGL